MLSVFLNGSNISNRCFEADDIEGFVGLYDVDATGNVCFPANGRRYYGDVRIELDKA